MGNSTSKSASSDSSAAMATSPHDAPGPFPSSLSADSNARPSRRSPTSSSSSSAVSPRSALPSFNFPERVRVESDEHSDTPFPSNSPSALSGVNAQSPSPFAQSPSPFAQGNCPVVSEISHPSPARAHIRHLSELIDPTLLAEDARYVRSPSGNLLTKRSFEERADRPLSIRERQDKIQQKVKLQRSQLGLREEYLAAEVQQQEPEKATTTKKKGCFLSCFS